MKSAFVLLCLILSLSFCTSARAEDALAGVRARGELVIATDATYPPFEYKENGVLQGFDVDLGTEIARELGVRIRWVPMEWAGVFGALESRKVDLIMSGVTITDARKKSYGFTRPYFLSGQVIARRKGDTTISGVDSLLQGKTVGVQQETTGQYSVEKRGLPKDRIHRFDQLQDALLDVRNHKSDAAVGDLPALRTMIRKGYPEIELVPGGVLADENVGIVARKGALDLVAAINHALETIMVDGRYAAMYQKWMEEPATTKLLGGLAAVADKGTTIPPTLLAQVGKTVAVTTAPVATGSALSIHWEILGSVLPQLLRGAVLTVELTALTLVFGVSLGLVVALARLSAFAPLRAVAITYIEAVRGTPLLMQIYVIYFVLPAIGLSLPSFVAGVAALSLNSAAYVAEIFRAGIESIDTGQMEAARALGMSYRQAMRFVILPQTVRRVLPPLTNEAVALLKDSSLVSVVALSELMRVGKEIATDAGSPTTVYLFVALLYLALTLPLTFLVRYLEMRWQPISQPRRRNPALPAVEQQAA